MKRIAVAVLLLASLLANTPPVAAAPTPGNSQCIPAVTDWEFSDAYGTKVASRLSVTCGKDVPSAYVRISLLQNGSIATSGNLTCNRPAIRVWTCSMAVQKPDPSGTQTFLGEGFWRQGSSPWGNWIYGPGLRT